MAVYLVTPATSIIKGLPYLLALELRGDYRDALFAGQIKNGDAVVASFSFGDVAYDVTNQKSLIPVVIQDTSGVEVTDEIPYGFDIIVSLPNSNPVRIVDGLISCVSLVTDPSTIGIPSGGPTLNANGVPRVVVRVDQEPTAIRVVGEPNASQLIESALTTHRLDPNAHPNAAGVLSINGLSGGVTLAGTGNVTVTPSGNTLNLSTTGLISQTQGDTRYRLASGTVPWEALTGVPIVSDSQNGLMSSAESIKLAGIEPGATGDLTTDELLDLLEAVADPNRYLNQTRGDARYQPLNANLTSISQFSGSGVASRNNFGGWSLISLGSAAQANTSDFATAAQGSAADSALTLASNAIPSSALGTTVQPYSVRLVELASLTPSVNQVPRWNGTSWIAADAGSGGEGGVSDHGLLTGLEDDDHPQYFNQTRGDARYQLADADLTAIGQLSGTGYAQRTGTNTWTLSTLGTAAQSNASEFATASQGLNADSALQPSAIGSSIQAYSANIAALAGVTATGFLRKDGTNTWISSPLVESDIPSEIARVTALTSHTSNTSNPHSTTASQVGALAIANNLSDLGNVTTARTNLGLGSAATQNSSAFLLAANNLSDVTAATARTNLGLVIGANVQAYSARLADISGLTATNGNVIRGNGTTWTSAALTAADVGAQATNANLSAIAGISTTGFYRRTGIGTATATSLVLGDIPDLSSLYQPLDGDLSAIAGLSTTGWLQRTADNTWSLGTPTAAQVSALAIANNLSDLNSAATARTNLGLGTAATQATTAFLQTANNLSDLANAATARTNLGLAIGTNVQAFSSNLSTIAGLTPTNGNVIRGNGTAWTSADLSTVFQPLDADLTSIAALSTTGWLQRTGANTWSLGTPTASQVGALATTNNLSDLGSAATARTNLGLGTAATQNTSAFLQPSNNLSDLGSASTARTNLGLTIGTNVQAYDAKLAAIAGLTPTSGQAIVGNGSTFVMGTVSSPNLIFYKSFGPVDVVSSGSTDVTASEYIIPANTLQVGDILDIHVHAQGGGTMSASGAIWLYWLPNGVSASQVALSTLFNATINTQAFFRRIKIRTSDCITANVGDTNLGQVAAAPITVTFSRATDQPIRVVFRTQNLTTTLHNFSLWCWRHS